MKANNHYKTYEIKPRITPVFLFFLLISLVLLFNGSFLAGTILTSLSFGILFLTSGLIIDIKNRKCKRIIYFLGFTFGKWEDLPDLQYISLLRVRRARKAYRLSSASIVQVSSKDYAYQINFIINEKRPRPMRIKSTTREKAIKEGLELGEYLNLKVLDFTTPNKKWIR